MSDSFRAAVLPIMALRGLTVFPDQTVHFDIGRPKSIKALEVCMKADQKIFLVPQKDIVIDDPGFADLYSVGTVVTVKQVLKNQGDTLRVLVNGICRAKITEVDQTAPYMSGIVEAVTEKPASMTPRVEALLRDANMLYGVYCEMTEHPASSLMLKMLSSDDPGFIADSIAQNSGIDYPMKAKLLAQLNPVKRLEMVVSLLSREIELLKLEADIQEKTHQKLDRNQRDYFLREQIRVIREELGEEDELSEFDDYRKKILALQLIEESEKKLLKDVDRLTRSRRRTCTYWSYQAFAR